MLFYLHELEQQQSVRSRSLNNRTKPTMISSYKQPLLNISIVNKTNYRSRNFLVRVFRNGGDGKCAYCASCSMDLILSEATRKLQLIRRAERLFDFRGKEIFRSEDIQRDMDYYVTEGEDFICPLEIIKPKLEYSLHSKWTLDGVTSSYTIKRPRRVRRRRQRSIKYDSNLELRNYEDRRSIIEHDNKHTQTVVKLCESKNIQTIGQLPSIIKTTQTFMDLETKGIQTDRNLPVIHHRDTQTIRQLELKNKDMQTDDVILREMKDAQTITVTITNEFRNKDIQTNEKPVSADNKMTQTMTIIKYEEKSIQIDIPKQDIPELTEQPIISAPDSIPARSSTETQSTQTEPLNSRAYRTTTTTKRRSVVDSTEILSPVIESNRARSAPMLSSSREVIYLRPLSVTNFRVRVYRNGERYRYAYCKSCTMDTILSAATQKLQMPIPARRLFDENGIEIFHSRDIQRGLEYYVSSGENFKKPNKI